MNEVIFHLDESNIREDLDYYTTSVRDKHGQIKPSDDIRSLTPLPSSKDSFLFPLEYYSLDRIYIGASIPLFSNSWGAAFLRELLKFIKPQGSIILPVYPEAEAQNKAYWCRSALEDVFRSRELWTGFSNVNAENDGVMSMRVGRKWPKEIPSTASWLMQQIGQLVASDLFAKKISSSDVESRFHTLAQIGWQIGLASGVCERVVQDYFGRSKALNICEVGSYGLLASELLSPMAHLSISNADAIVESSELEQVRKLHANLVNFIGRKVRLFSQCEDRKYQVVFVNIANHNEELLSYLDKYWNMVDNGGILVCRSALASSDDVSLKNAIPKHYYSYVAMEINKSAIPTHYSSTMFAYNKKQQSDKHGAFHIFLKSDA